MSRNPETRRGGCLAKGWSRRMTLHAFCAMNSNDLLKKEEEEEEEEEEEVFLQKN